MLRTKQDIFEGVPNAFTREEISTSSKYNMDCNSLEICNMEDRRLSEAKVGSPCCGQRGVGHLADSGGDGGGGEELNTNRKMSNTRMNMKTL